MNDDYKIRLAVSEDAGEIARLLTLLGHPASAADIQERWQHWAAEGNTCFVAQSGGGPLGGIVTLHRMRVLHRPRPVGRITALVVEQALRGQGVGRALVRYAESYLSHSGCGLLEITSNVSLKQAHAFYQHLGYERSSERFSKVLTQ